MQPDMSNYTHAERQASNTARNPRSNTISSIAYKMAGGSKRFYELRTSERYRIRALARQRMEGVGTYGPLKVVPKINSKESKPVASTRMSRPGATRFRNRVLGRDKACIITRTPVGTYLYSHGTKTTVIHAAHIIPHKMSTPQQYDDVNNGLTMTAGMHADFDNALFTIGDNKQILPSRWAALDQYPPFIQMLDKYFTETMRGYLARHRKWAMRQWNRWSF